jgi:hypothetical protein
MKKIIIMIFVLICLFLVSCAPSELTCTQDSDCVPNKCCHADGVVNQENAPECSGVLCTTQCQEGTLDCGQAAIKCVENECQAIFK